MIKKNTFLKSILLFTLSQQTFSMNINQLPSEMIAEIITFAAIQEANNDKDYLWHERMKSARKNLDEGYELRDISIKMIATTQTASEWHNDAIKPHFIAFNKAIVTLSLVCKKWYNQKDIIGNVIENYINIYKIQLTYLAKPILLGLKNQANKQYFAMFKMLYSHNLITPHMSDCSNNHIDLPHHPHFNHPNSQIICIGGSFSHINVPTYWSLLHYAVYTYDLKVLELLLSTKTIPISTRDTAGVTPLHIATHNSAEQIYNTETHEYVRFLSDGQYACIKLLLEYGADPTIKDIYGQTPADYTDSLRVLDLLQEYTPVAEPSHKKRKL